MQNLWPDGAPTPMGREDWVELRGLLLHKSNPGFAALQSVLRLATDASLPCLDPWVQEMDHELFCTDVRSLPQECARLVVPDWKAWIDGSWTPILKALVSGERLVLLLDEHLPELLDPLIWALHRLCIDLSGICIHGDQRSESVSALLATGCFPEVQVTASQTDRARWLTLVQNAARLEQVPSAVDLAFGFGVQSTSGAPHLEFSPLTSTCRNLEKSMLRAGENWESILEEALEDSLGRQGALGGYLNGAVGQWILPASHFSVATEWLLCAVEERGVLDPPIQSMNRASKAELEQIRARALGEGATLIHEALGSTGRGQDGTLSRQIFTNVSPGSGLSQAPGNTPTLLLSRGDLGPYEAPYRTAK
ncbi:MAG: hypothetical protein GY930_22335 [bacterium]|nr:hypothetical protein [bacterium]